MKTQRDYLFNEYVSLGKNVKNSKEKIGMLETMINGLEKHVKSSVSLENIVNKIVLKGGGMDFTIFEYEIAGQMETLNKHMENVDSDKKFVENKIKELHGRMKNVVDNNEHLFNIKTQIDWIVKEFENKESVEIMETANYDELLEKVKNAIKTASTKGNIQEDIADYIHKLEEYAVYLENFIKSNTKILNTVDTSKQSIRKSKTLIDTQLQEKIMQGGQLIRNKQYGSGLMLNRYNELSTANQKKILEQFNEESFAELDISNLKIYLDEKYQIIKTIQVSELEIFEDNISSSPSSLSSPSSSSSSSSINDIITESTFYGKVVTIYELLKQLNYTIDIYKKTYKALSDNIEIFSHKESMEGHNVIEMWNKVFEKKNTDYYKKQILELKIFYFDDEDNTFENALTNIVVQDLMTKKLKVISLSTLDETIEIIDNTLVAFDHLLYFLSSFLLIVAKMNEAISLSSTPSTTPSITSSFGTTSTQHIAQLEEFCKQKVNILLRTGIMTTFLNYDNVYEMGKKIQLKGGAYIIPIIIENSVEQKKINIDGEKILVLVNLFTSYTSHLAEPNDKSATSTVNIEYVEKLNALTQMFDKLYFKIALKLGDDVEHFKIENETRPKNYSEYLSIINTKSSDTLTHFDISGTLTHSSKKPRLDQFIIDLTLCKNKLKPFVQNLVALKYINSEKRNGQFELNETIALLELYTTVNNQILQGINSYIQVLPMIFFTVEFPPSIYKSAPCKYEFTYDTKKELVSYTPMEETTKDKCNEILGDDSSDYEKTIFSSHAAFFESNKANGTKKIIDDPVIGLDKLIKFEDDKNKPVNKVMNIMFALGASGTGKTTRYFGKDGANPDDSVGIVPHIINKSKMNMTEDASSRISLAYFVCYGRNNSYKSESRVVSTGVIATATNVLTNVTRAITSRVTGSDFEEDKSSVFNELNIFVNLNIIKAEQNKEKPSTDDDKYIPYFMPSATKEEEELSINNYTQFYAKLVNKKLRKCNFDQVKDFVCDGKPFNKKLLNNEINTENDVSFRKILTNNNEIWYDINNSENLTNELSKLFEYLINEQKKINTVLPTKNNIESSRGHTCVLIRIGDEDNCKYFPLFDMAGTENPDVVNEFFKTGRNLDHMTKLIKKINLVSQNDKIMSSDEKIEYPSLGDLLENKLISEYVKTEQIGGKGKMTVDNLVRDLEGDTSPINKEIYEPFLTKIVDEGKYINHTIGMIIFAAMCVGTSLNTIKTESEDTFDTFGVKLFEQLNNYICTMSSRDCYNTKVLLEEMNYNNILNSSCIWLQIIFSFLYWNEETQDSTNHWLTNIDANGESLERNQEYIQEMTELDYEFFKEIPFKYIEICSKLEVDILNEVMVIIKDLNSKCHISLTKTKIIMDNGQLTLKSENSFQGGGKKGKRKKKATVKFITTSTSELCSEATRESLNENIKEKLQKCDNLKQLLMNDYYLSIINNKYFLWFDPNIANESTIKKESTGDYDDDDDDDEADKIDDDNDNKPIECGNIAEIMNAAKKYLKKLPDPHTLITDNKLQTELNQMHRVQDGRIAATKMVLMHLVTGQGVKHFMVKDTIKLAETLYKSTDLKLTDLSQHGGKRPLPLLKCK